MQEKEKKKKENHYVVVDFFCFSNNNNDSAAETTATTCEGDESSMRAYIESNLLIISIINQPFEPFFFYFSFLFFFFLDPYLAPPLRTHHPTSTLSRGKSRPSAVCTMSITVANLNRYVGRGRYISFSFQASQSLTVWAKALAISSFCGIFPPLDTSETESAGFFWEDGRTIEGRLKRGRSTVTMLWVKVFKVN